MPRANIPAYSTCKIRLGQRGWKAYLDVLVPVTYRKIIWTKTQIRNAHFCSWTTKPMICRWFRAGTLPPNASSAYVQCGSSGAFGQRPCATLASFVIFLAGLGSWVISSLSDFPFPWTTTVMSLYKHEKVLNMTVLPGDMLSGSFCAYMTWSE